MSLATNPWKAACSLHTVQVRRLGWSYDYQDAVQDFAGAVAAGCQNPDQCLAYLRRKPLGYSQSNDPMPLELVQERRLLRELGKVVGEALGNKTLGKFVGLLLARKRKLPSVSEVARTSGYVREECELILRGVETVLIRYLENLRVENPDGFLSNDIARLQKQERMARSAPVELEPAPY